MTGPVPVMEGASKWYTMDMLKTVFTAISCLIAVSSGAVTWTVAPLPASEFADTEVSTNVCLGAAVETAAGDGLGYFDVTLSLRATPTNNVEICFGCDANGDGALGRCERDFVLGWDCGAWFWRDRRANVETRFGQEVCSDDRRTLRWRVDLDARRCPRRFAAREGDSVLAEGRATDAMFAALWTHGRVVARGLDAPDEAISVQLGARGLKVVIE